MFEALWPNTKDIIQAAAASYLAFFAAGLLMLGVVATRLFDLRDSNRIRFTVFLIFTFFIGGTPLLLSFTKDGENHRTKVVEALTHGVWAEEQEDHSCPSKGRLKFYDHGSVIYVESQDRKDEEATPLDILVSDVSALSAKRLDEETYPAVTVYLLITPEGSSLKRLRVTEGGNTTKTILRCE